MSESEPILAKPFDARLQFPTNIILSVPTMSGKTTWVLNLLDNRDRLISKPINYILWCTGNNPDSLFCQRLKQKYGQLIDFHFGLPEESYLDTIIGKGTNVILIYDDLMASALDSQTTLKVFVQKTHHQQIMSIFILQNLFAHGKHRLTMLRNSTYLVILNHILDRTVLNVLGNRFFPKGGSVLSEIMMRKTQTNPYYAIFIDAHILTPPIARIRGDIFGPVQTVFII